jgi:hypothetical protein
MFERGLGNFILSYELVHGTFAVKTYVSETDTPQIKRIVRRNTQEASTLLTRVQTSSQLVTKTVASPVLGLSKIRDVELEVTCSRTFHPTRVTQPTRPTTNESASDTCQDLCLSVMISHLRRTPVSKTHRLTALHYTFLPSTVASLQHHFQWLPNAAALVQPPNRQISRPSHSTAPQTKSPSPVPARTMRRRTCSRKAREKMRTLRLLT